MTTKRKLLMASAGAGAGAGGGALEIEFLGTIVARSGTNSGYTAFSGTKTGLAADSGVTIIAVLQSRDAGGSPSNPYSSVTINSQSATIIDRNYPNQNDFNSSAIAYISDVNISSSISVNVALGVYTHEGQANIFLYKVSTPSQATSNGNFALTTNAVSRNITTPSSDFATVVIATTSNSASAVDITPSSGSLTEDVSKDGGTTEFVTVSHSTDIPSGQLINFTADNGGSAACHTILIACFAQT